MKINGKGLGKRIIAMLLALLMVFTMMPIQTRVIAADAVNVGLTGTVAFENDSITDYSDVSVTLYKVTEGVEDEKIGESIAVSNDDATKGEYVFTDIPVVAGENYQIVTTVADNTYYMVPVSVTITDDHVASSSVELGNGVLIKSHEATMEFDDVTIPEIVLEEGATVGSFIPVNVTIDGVDSTDSYTIEYSVTSKSDSMGEITVCTTENNALGFTNVVFASGYASGTATITATLSGEKYKTVSQDIEVTFNQSLHKIGFSFDTPSYDVDNGMCFKDDYNFTEPTLKGFLLNSDNELSSVEVNDLNTVNPEVTVKYTSSHPEIVGVDENSGVVTVKKLVDVDTAVTITATRAADKFYEAASEAYIINLTCLEVSDFEANYTIEGSKEEGSEWYKEVSVEKPIKVTLNEGTNYKIFASLPDAEMLQEEGKVVSITSAEQLVGGKVPFYVYDTTIGAISAVQYTDVIKVDTKNPDVSIEWKNETILPDKLYFFLLENFGVLNPKFEVQGSDTESSVTSYYYVHTDIENPIVDLSTLEETSWTRIDQNVTEINIGNECKKIIIYAKAVDEAGRVSYANTVGLIADNTAPTVGVLADETTGGYVKTDAVEKGYFTSDFKVNISITEEEGFSGIKELIYWVGEENAEDSAKTKVEVLSNENPTYGDLIYTYTEELTVTAENYNTEDGFVLFVQAKDCAGNTSEIQKYEFNVSTDEPTVNLVFDKTGGKEIDGVAYYNENRIATVTIISRTDLYDQANVVLKINGQVITVASWTGDKIFTVPFTESKDIQSIQVEYVDKLGREDGTELEQFLIDTTPATATVSFGSQTSQSLLSSFTFGQMNASGYSVSIDAQDEISAVLGKDITVQYYISNSGVIYSETELNALAADKWVNYNSEISCTSEGRYIVYFKVTDYVGNTAYFSTNGFVVDATDGTVAVTTEQTTTGGYYTSNVTYDVVVNEAGDLYSGIKEIRYEVYNGDTKTQGDILYNFDNTNPTLDDLISSVADKHIVVDAQANNGDNIRVIVYVIDNAGNTVEEEVSLKINSTCPIVNVSYDINNATQVDGVYYFKDLRVATITIQDKAFDATKATEAIEVKLWDKQDGTAIADTGISISEWTSDSSTNTHTATVAFTKDGYYTLNVNYENTVRLTNDGIIPTSGTVAAQAFVIDTTKATIEVEFDNNIDTDRDGDKGYFLDSRKATIFVTEKNFNVESFRQSITITATDAKGTVIASAIPVITQISPDALGADQYAFEINFTSNANYTFAIAYKDNAGLDSEVIEYTSGTITPNTFAIDNEKPTGTITVGELGAWGTLQDRLSYEYFSTKDLSVAISVSDEITNIETVEYFKTSSNTVMSLEDLKNHTEWVTYAPFKLTQSEHTTIYVKAVDTLGNTSYFSTNRIILDKDKVVVEYVKPQVSVNPQQPVNGFYTGDVTVDLSVVEPTATGTGTYSGLKNIRYEVYSLGTKTQEGTFFNFEVSNPSLSQLVTTWAEKDIIVDASKNNSNDVLVKLFVTDNAGNVTEETVNLKIDATKPTVNVSYDNNSGDTSFSDSVYYNSNRTATITVTERNFDPNKVNITITNTDRTIPTISEWVKTTSGTGNGDNSVYTTQIVYSADGDYTFAISCTDVAGQANNGVNYGESQAVTAFTIDKTTPTISVSYDNNSALNENYFGADRHATITIVEHNFDDSRVTVNIGATDDGTQIGAPVLSGWSTSGDIHTAVVDFNTDALYTFDIAYNDKAGNVAVDFAEQTFYVDKTKPTIAITEIVDQSVNNQDTIGFVITATDTNFDSFDVILTATIKTENGFETKELSIASVSEITNGRLYTVNNIESDGLYSITCTAVDKAGNAFEEVTLERTDGSTYVENRTAEDTIITFSVNRNGSTYDADEYTTSIMSNYYNFSVDNDIVLHELSTNELQSYVITLNGENLQDGSDYTVSTSGGDGAWVRYTYTISKELFINEGEYVLVVSSVDGANNNTYSDVKNAKFSFVVDRTAPIVIVSGLENGASYQVERQNVSIIPTDDGGMISSLIVRLIDGDGNVIKELMNLSGDDLQTQLEEGNGTLSITVESGVNQNVEIICSDSSVNSNGLPNTYQVVYEDISVAASALELFFAGDTFTYIAIGGVAVVGVGVGIATGGFSSVLAGIAGLIDKIKLFFIKK